MEKCKKFLKRCFFLPPLLNLVLAVIGYGLVLSVVIFEIKNPVFQYISYIASAYALMISVTGFPHLISFFKSVRQYLYYHSLTEKIRNTAFGARFFDDVHFRSGVFLHQGFLINLFYILIKLVSGIVYRSAWLVWLAIYYTLLAAMRLLLIRGLNKQDEAEALRRYRLCGVILLFMNQALTVLVIFIVHQNQGYHYPGVLIYAMAFYAFYAVIMSIISIVKTRRMNSPILSAAKAINFVAALVSMLSLETAMISQFGGDTPYFRMVMTGASGGAVCTIVIAMAIYMIWNANQKLKNIKLEQNRNLSQKFN